MMHFKHGTKLYFRLSRFDSVPLSDLHGPKFQEQFSCPFIRPLKSLLPFALSQFLGHDVSKL